MKREQLKELGLEDAVIEKVIGLHGSDIEKFKADATALKTEADGLKKQLTEASSAIEGFKALKPDELKAAADEYKAKFEQAQLDSSNQINALKFDHALEAQLKIYKVKDAADVIPHLKKDKLQLGDAGEIIGLNEQIEPLKKNKDYLFESDNLPPPRIVSGGNHQNVGSDAFGEAMLRGARVPTPQGK